VAVTLLAVLMVTTHVGMRTQEQAPPHPAKTWERSGDAVRVIRLSSANASEQSTPHAMPAGRLVTDPPPSGLTVRVKVWMNVAVTALTAFIVTTQVPTPEHPAPLQPENKEFVPGVATRVTTVPIPNASTQSEPQVTPDGVLVMVPAPAPVRFTVRLNTRVNVAVTSLAAFMVTAHAAVPVHAPVQPVNADPMSAFGVRMTTVP
jgi:hypothetical protein